MLNMTSTDAINLIESETLQPSTIDMRYASGPFQHVMNMQPRKKAKVFEQMLRDIFTKTGHEVEDRDSGGYSFILDGDCIDVIGSTMTKNNEFKLNQIRPKNEWDECYIVLVYPTSISILGMNKKTVNKCVKKGVFTRQHKGMEDTSATYAYSGSEDLLVAMGAAKVV